MSLRDYVLPSVLLAGGLAGIGARVYNCAVGESLRNIPEVSRYASLEEELADVSGLRAGVRSLFPKSDKSLHADSFLEYLNQRQNLIQTEIKNLESENNTREKISAFRNNRDSSDFYGFYVFGGGIILCFSALGSFFEILKKTK